MYSKAQFLQYLDQQLYPRVGEALESVLGVNFIQNASKEIPIGDGQSVSAATLEARPTAALLAMHDYVAQGVWDGHSHDSGDVLLDALAFIGIAHGVQEVSGEIPSDFLDDLMEKAQARWRLDCMAAHDQTLSFRDVAALSGMSVPSVKAAVAAGEFRSDRGKIEPQDAFPWILSKGYKPTVWVQVSESRKVTSSIELLLTSWAKEWSVNTETLQATLGCGLGDLSSGELTDQTSKASAAICKAYDITPCYLSAHVKALTRVPEIREVGLLFDANTADRFISIPRARDGSMFTPELHRRTGFCIGKKGEEHRIQDFDKALAELRRMNAPYWRRPSKTSPAWGIVKGVEWVDVPRDQLGMGSHHAN